MTSAIYPGSFDPVTMGHLDVIRRSAAIVDHLIVAVLNNGAKSPLFSVSERVSMLKDVTRDLPNVEVMSFSGLLVDFAKQNSVTLIIRGLRAVTDFESELAMAQTNRVICPGIETFFLCTSLRYAYLSSSTVKEVAKNHGDIRQLVPPSVVPKIYEKYGIKHES
jgi:pantetheine-phosphate adenylyltransferase